MKSAEKRLTGYHNNIITGGNSLTSATLDLLYKPSNSGVPNIATSLQIFLKNNSMTQRSQPLK